MTKSALTGAERAIADKILHVLSLFPKISPSMLQISLGSGIPTEVWKPVLDKLILSEEVYRYTKQKASPAGRQLLVTYISSSPDDEPVNAG